MSNMNLSQMYRHDGRSDEANRWQKLLGRAPRALVVEDNAGILSAVRDWFDIQGWEIQGAGDGSKFFKVVEPMISGTSQRERFDVIVADISMPGLNVMKILEGLRTSGSDIPIVVISAIPDRNLPHKVRRLGMAEFFRKPFQMSDVYAAASRLLMCANDSRTIH